MISVSITEFQEHFAEYLDRVAHGETFSISRDQCEIAQVVPRRNSENHEVGQPLIKRQFGSAKGLIQMREDFDMPLEGFIATHLTD